MAERRRLTLQDLEGASTAALQGSTQASRRRSLNLRDLGMEDVEKEPAPFAEGSRLGVTVPLPGEWPTYWTDIPLGTGTAQALAGAGKRLSDLRMRGQQLAGVEGVQEEIDRARERDRPLMSTTPAMLGSMLPDIVATSPLGSLGVRGGAALGALQGFLQPTTSEEGAIEGTALNALMGGTGGALGAAIGQGAVNLAGKAANLVPGAIPSGVREVAARRGVQLPKIRWQDAEAQRLNELAKSKGVNLSIGDLEPDSGWVRAENLMENMPSGRREFLQRQSEQVRESVEGLRDKFTGDMRGKEGAKIVEGVKEQYKKNKEMAAHLFNNVKMLSRESGVQPIKPNETFNTAQAALNEYPDLFGEFKNNAFMKKLLGLERDTGPQPGLILNPKNMKPFKYDQELTFDEAQFVRKRLGSWLEKLNNQWQKGSLPQGLDGNAVRQASQVFAAFERDLDNWGTQSGNNDLNNAWKTAREYFKENVAPYRDPGKLESKTPLIRNIVNDNVDPATIPDKVLPTRETSIAQDVMELASPEGQKAVKSALVNKITEEATSPDIQGLDAAALLRYTNKHGHSGERVFNPDEQAEIAAVRDIVRSTQRSSDPGRLNEGKGRLVSAVLGGSAMMGVPFLGAQVAGAVGGMSPTEQALMGLAALPGLAVLGGRGANAYTSGALGKNIHFADPNISGALGGLQQMIRGASLGAGQPILEQWRTGNLGHQP